MWKGGIFMDSYILNEDVLCFTQDDEKTNRVLIIEKNKKVSVGMSCLKFLKRCCKIYGHSYDIQRQFIIDNFNYYIKTPIIVSEYDNLIFFPTTSPNSKNCIWISYNNVDRYVEENDYTRIYFKGGKILKISASFTTIDNQITKCIKIEKFINSLKLKKDC